MESRQIRKKFLKFFKDKGHRVIPSASLVPELDPTVLFTTAGMHPLVPYLLGQEHAEGRRLTNVQKCLRTDDIDEVGDISHNTFFEMLGNWSLGDYFKKEAIEWSWEFLTSPDWLRLDKNKIFVTVFAGDNNAPRDEESAKIWESVGLPKERIFYYEKKENWWNSPGETGPCGPDTEMFYDIGKEPCGPECEPKCDCGKYVEIWNDVFMEYNKVKESGGFRYEKLKQANVDTGMGLERVTMILQTKRSVYETDLFEPIIRLIEKLSGSKYDEQIKSFRVIADHLRAATFAIADGVEPTNTDRGYIVRRLIRRAIREGRKINIDGFFTHKIGDLVIENYKDIYPELNKSKDLISQLLVREEEKFGRTLERGLKEFEKQIKVYVGWEGNVEPGKNVIPGKVAFDLFSTYGFPIELVEEIAQEKGLVVDKNNFNEELKKHQELSRRGAEAKFKGGLSDSSEMTVKLHTATHLLHQALREVLGGHVQQKGSNITPERLRFDFSHPQKMSEDEIEKVENLINKKINQNLEVIKDTKTPEEAQKEGFIGLFNEKYGEKVTTYGIGDFSKEICGGPHVENIGKLGRFKIIKEESAGAGVRRIKAVLK